MPYDYPGEYALRFDGDDKARPSAVFKRISGPDGLIGLRPSEAGTIKIENLKSANVRGRMILSQWVRATTSAGGPPKDLTIEALNRARIPISRWRVLNARPVRWVVNSGTTSAKNEVAIETLEIAHRGMLPD